MKQLILIAIAILGFATYAPCQETRATLTGLVADPTGAVVPNAPIEVVNVDTGATTHVKSNGQGSYTVPFLQPGNYKIRVQMEGFKAYLHTGLELQVDATVKENIVLQVGSVNESVLVTTATPMIDTSNADTGQSLTAEEVRDLPNNGNSPFALERDEYGVIPTGKQATVQLTPTSNTTASQVSIGGGQSASAEVPLNGIPDMESSSRQISYIPQLDAVNSVHVDQFSANAALGDTIGGTVNITTKSGTNQFHGTLSEYYNGGALFPLGLTLQRRPPTSRPPITISPVRRSVARCLFLISSTVATSCFSSMRGRATTPRLVNPLSPAFRPRMKETATFMLCLPTVPRLSFTIRIVVATKPSAASNTGFDPQSLTTA